VPSKVRVLADAKRRGDPLFSDFLIADSPIYLLVRAATRYEHVMDDALREIGMDLPSWRALMIVQEKSPSSVSEIAERAVVKLSTMTRVVQRLEKKGLVKLARRESDARVTEVSITASGERAASKVREVASRIYTIAFRDHSAGEIKTFNEMLRSLYVNLGRS
jgi:MarR family transcriptional regulator, organic hydroperoxide resistance regulator